MARFVAVLLLLVLPAVALAARPARQPMLLQGKVYCDNCRAGFETPLSTYIPGAKVRVECKDTKTMQLLYSQETTTDSTGSYKMVVSEDHQDQTCDALLVSSPDRACSTPAAGRDRARVILTRNNGMASDNRYANAMGFMKTEAVDGCAKVLQMYQDFE
ncbi:hypothetical protein MLD38_034780 [Melastoma candidum]|uniref:Uncharacterized protein n=1 Tax=Melastoma candidum TaxID=119954 RepID=A0ACB9MBK1_9MYRT|nr:hypothetical protein MLD38_034780 [Melastoma candidum]